MKNIKTTLFSLMLLISFVLAEDYNEIQLNELKQKAFYEMLQKIYSESMAAKRAFKATNLREDPISNFATTAPRSEFIVNADISSELQDGAESAMVYVSIDNQATWQSAIANPLGTDGYENTWGGTINTGSGNSAFAYLSGTVNSCDGVIFGVNCFFNSSLFEIKYFSDSKYPSIKTVFVYSFFKISLS